MAGGKETPRQKMIGMMYLVLTALLALNVSITVIEKFLFINESLERANNSSITRNKQIIASIKKSVDDSGNRPDDVKVVESAEELRTKTAQVHQYMEELKDTFIEITGGYEDGHDGESAYMVGKTDYDKVGHYMMPSSEGGEGHGLELRKQLEDYVAYLKGMLKTRGAKSEEIEVFDQIALDAEDDPIYREDPNQQGKKFSQLAFESSPTPAGLATVSEFQSQVLNYETRVLDFLAKSVGAADIKFDRVVPMVLPQSQTVAAGAKYTADMFIAASSSGITPEMSVDGKKIQVEDGFGKVEFTAKPGKYDKTGMVKKSYEAAIKVRLPNGQDTTYKSPIEYFVVKPIIQIQSQSVQALYLNCGNELDVQVPALGNSYNPSFSARGGLAIKGAQVGQVTVVPKSGKLTLTVSNGGNRIGSRTFQVKRIPAPAIKAYIGNREVNLKQGMPYKTARIDLRVIADESFSKFLPKDSKFRVRAAVVTLVRAGIGGQSINVKGPAVNLGPIAARARKGDNLVIEIKKVARANFRKEIEDFNRYNNEIISIPLR